MTDTSAATIRIGGALWQALFPTFQAAVEADRARLGYYGEWFSEETLPDDAPLELFAREATGGRFAHIEAFCVAHKLPFIRWCEARPREWDAERVAYSGEGEPLHFLATDEDEVAIIAADIERFETIDALLAHLKSATPPLPPFHLVASAISPAVDSPDDIADFPYP